MGNFQRGMICNLRVSCNEIVDVRPRGLLAGEEKPADALRQRVVKTDVFRVPRLELE